jgi:formylmethanofuran dehydrogenase subunit E
MAELNDVVKRARIACSSCGFEKTSKDDNVDPFDEFVCGGCAATNI